MMLHGKFGMIDKNFWKNRRVLVTGCTGFKGSWLVTWLVEMGADVYGYALNPCTDPSMFNLLNLVQKIRYQEGNICDYEFLRRFINSVNPEIIFHLAAQPLVRYSYQNPLETYQTNVIGVVNLLEIVRKNKNVKAILNITTDKCYENKEWLWGYRENEPLGGYDPYSNSKACSELVTSCYQQSYFNLQEYQKNQHNTLLASVRAGNVIGGGDWSADRLIPDMIKNFLNNKELKIRNPGAIRPWQHVLEPLIGYLLLAQKLYNGETSFASAWNFGPNDYDTKSVEYIANKLCEYWGREKKWSLDNLEHPHEANFLKLDCSKAKTVLQWQPKWNLDKSLQEVVKWYKCYEENKKNLYQVTINQIRDYIESI